MLIEFKGVLTFEVIGQLLNELKNKMDKLGEKVNTYKRILVIMVETLENICKYTDHHTDNNFIESDYPTIFSLVKKDESYWIAAGNLIRTSDQDYIKERIVKVNQLSPVELKKLYRQTIADGNFNSEGGAGLGFIEIAKSSGKKIDFHFQKVNNNKAFFTINLEITEH